MPKADKVCPKLGKYGKVCQKLIKCAQAKKVWQSVSKSEKVCQKLRKYGKCAQS